MKIILDETGAHMPDAEVEAFVDSVFPDYDGRHGVGTIHVSQMLVIDCIRAKLIKIPPMERPEIEWIFYGKTVHFDRDVRSHDAWDNPLADLNSKFLGELI